jgi:hypothetical protein
MVLDEVVRLQSKDLLHYYYYSKVDVDVTTGALKKKGEALKVEDPIHPNGDGKTWEVKGFIYNSARINPRGSVQHCFPRGWKGESLPTSRRIDISSNWYQSRCSESSWESGSTSAELSEWRG